MSSLFAVSSKRAFFTGSARGIGRAIAETLSDDSVTATGQPPGGAGTVVLLVSLTGDFSTSQNMVMDEGTMIPDGN